MKLLMILLCKGTYAPVVLVMRPWGYHKFRPNAAAIQKRSG